MFFVGPLVGVNKYYVRNILYDLKDFIMIIGKLMMHQNSPVNDQLVGIKNSSSKAALDVSSAAIKDGTNES